MSRVTLLAALSIVLVTSACGSRLNPLNWFGQDEEVQIVAPDLPGNVDDPRPFVAQVESVRAERAPGGAIVSVVGLPPSQGYWEPALLIENDGVPTDGVLTIQFRASAPFTQKPQSSQASRELTAAIYLTEQEMSGVRTITVRGAGNARSVRR